MISSNFFAASIKYLEETVSGKDASQHEKEDSKDESSDWDLGRDHDVNNSDWSHSKCDIDESQEFHCAF